MKRRLLTLPLGASAAATLDEEGPIAILRLGVDGEVSFGADGKFSPEGAIALSRALALFALRHLPEHLHAEISNGIPTLGPEYETTGVGAPPGIEPPSRVSG